MNAETLLEATALTHRFGAFTACEDVDLVLYPGEVLGVVGESGSGKSTILRAVTGLAPDWSGRICVDGATLGKTRPRNFYKTVQMVFQDPYASLHPRHSVDAVLGETLYLHGITNIDSRVAQLLDDVGLEQKFRFRYPHQLSAAKDNAWPSPARLRRNRGSCCWMNQRLRLMCRCRPRF